MDPPEDKMKDETKQLTVNKTANGHRIRPEVFWKPREDTESQEG